MEEQIKPKPVRRFAFDAESMYETEHGKYVLYSDHAETVQQLQRDLEIEKQRVVDLGVLCLESVPRESLEKQRVLYEMAVKGRADMREALRSERDKVQQLQRENVEVKQENGTLHMLCEDRFNEIAELRAELAAAKRGKGRILAALKDAVAAVDDGTIRIRPSDRERFIARLSEWESTIIDEIEILTVENTNG